MVATSPEGISPKSIGKVQRAKFKVQSSKSKVQRAKFKEQSARANISAMNKKRGGSLFFIPYLYSLLYTLYSLLYISRLLTTGYCLLATRL